MGLTMNPEIVVIENIPTVEELTEALKLHRSEIVEADTFIPLATHVHGIILAVKKGLDKKTDALVEATVTYIQRTTQNLREALDLAHEEATKAAIDRRLAIAAEAGWKDAHNTSLTRLEMLNAALERERQLTKERDELRAENTGMRAELAHIHGESFGGWLNTDPVKEE